MAETVVLHVGAMKSGTSYVQARLFANRAALLERGVLVPGRVWVDQVNAVRAVLGKRPDGSVGQPWERLVEQVAAAPGTAVVSMEFLGPSRAVVARRVVASLGPAAVRVVVTARDLNRSLAAMWQETVQNGRTWTWREYLTEAEARRPGTGPGTTDRTTPGGTFWRQQNLHRMVSRWSTAIDGPVHLVTLPPPGAPAAVLWQRFCQAAGLPDEGLAEVPRSNESLGLASTLALLRLNRELEDNGTAWDETANLRKHVLAKRILASRRAVEPSLGLPVADWVVEQSDQTVRRLQELGPVLVGDWADLAPAPVPGVDPEDVPETEITQAALQALAGLVDVMISR